MARLVKKATKACLVTIEQDSYGARLEVRRSSIRGKTWVDIWNGTELVCFLLTPRVKAALRKALR